MSENVLNGHVTRHDGSAAGGVVVRAFARRLRSEVPLGEAVTDARGDYRIEYPRPDASMELLARTDGAAADVRVNPGVSERIDFVLPPDGRTEYESLLADVRPLLDGAGLADLGDDDFPFLARATGRETARVRLLATAHRHAVATGTSAEQHYGLLRQGMPADLSKLAARPAADIQAALATAADNDVISAADADPLVGKLRAIAADPAERAVSSPIAELFALVISDPTARERVFGAYVDNEEAFWADADTAEHAERLRLVLRLGTLTMNNVPLVTELLDRFDRGELEHPRDLTRLHDQWGDLVRDTGGTPDEARAALDSPDDGYAELVATLVAEAFPTAHIAYRLSDRDEPAARFLSDNPEFDLTSTPVNAATVPDEQARADLAGIQRAMKIAPRFDAMQTLRDNGFTSSYAVASIAAEDFAEQVAGNVGAHEAAAIHARATHVHATAVNLVTDLRTAGQIDVPWLPGVQALTTKIPNWEDLFGSADYCTCKECRSIYSEAAYLADLLFYLRRLGGSTAPSGTSGDGPVADVIFARRPDLWHVDLSCDNTNLGLPYVDLVNEVLEHVVAPEPWTAIDPALRQSSGDSTQLRIQPQHVNAGAYSKLDFVLYPWDMPFDLWGEQGRAYLGHLGVRRDELMTTLNPGSDSSARVVAEYLGLNTVSYRIITGQPLSYPRTLAEFYGRPANTTPEALANALFKVRAMLDTAGMRYAELTELLDTRFVNPGTLAIRATDPKHPCDTTLLNIEGLNGPTLDRIHRFVRLRRALGVSAAELDRVIDGSHNQGKLDSITARGIAAVKRVAARLNLPWDRVLGFYGPLDTHDYQTETEPPLYDRLFLNPAVVPPRHRYESHPFQLNAERTELKTIGYLRTPAVTAALLGVLELTDEDLTELTTGPRAVVADNQLNLANLSALVRTVTLARVTGLSIGDLLRLIELYGASPFVPSVVADDSESELAAGALMRLPVRPAVRSTVGGPESELAVGALMRPAVPPGPGAPPLPPVDALVTLTERFLDAVDAIKSWRFGIAELESVLSAVPQPDGVVPDDFTLATVLTSLRSALQAVYQQTAQTTDENGDLTRKHLALLGWDTVLVQDAVSTLRGTIEYAVTLTALPKDLVFPLDVPVRYDADAKLLSFTGPMNDEQAQALRALAPAAADYQAALTSLYAEPRKFVADRMKALRIPVGAASLAKLPPGFVLPKELAGKVFHDVTQQTLRSRSYLSETEFTALEKASDDSAFRAAVAQLRTAQAEPAAPDNVFLTATDAATLFNAKETAAADRFHLVLTKLAPYLRRTLSETAVKQQLGQAVGLDAALADSLISTWLRSPNPGRSSALLDFLTPAYVGSDPAVTISRAGFAEQFTTLSLLYRVALVLSRLRITAGQLPVVFGHSAAGWLDLNSLPTKPIAGPSPLFGSFVRLLDLARLRDTIPGGTRTLTAVFDLARTGGVTVAQLMAELSRQTTWDNADLDVIARLIGFRMPAELADEQGLLKLVAAAGLVRRLGVAADRVEPWLAADLTQTDTRAMWQAAKARHTIDDWPAAATPMQDRLRDRQRAALVSYLIAYPLRAQNGTPHWTTPNEMFDYFLLDVEAGTAQQTTRIAQAINSIQLFVQRCLLNLEPLVRTADTAVWREWKWARQFRLWAANQKVFLYPENYFEPDLRADRTPFFTDFQNELLQKEVTDENVETAFRAYLSKLDEVARLQPCGMYHHFEPGTDPENPKETLYVFARSESTPRAYYFRTRVQRAYWTPWERVDLDIDGDALVPVVWNQRLYLFWPNFIRMADAQVVKSLPDGGWEHEMKEPPSYQKIQLNWSQYVNGKWQAKRIGREALYTPTSADDWDRHVPSGYAFRPDVAYSSAGDLYLASIFNETLFYAPDNKPHVHFGYFILSFRRGTITTQPMRLYRVNPAQPDPSEPPPDPPWIPESPVVDLPGPTENSNNEFVQVFGTHPSYRRLEVHDPRVATYEREQIPLLFNTKGPQKYRLLYPHQYGFGVMWEKFNIFFTDGTRSFMLEPKVTRTPVSKAQVKFTQFYHPHVESFVRELALKGLDGLFARDIQLNPGKYTGLFDFATYYDVGNAEHLLGPYPNEILDFDASNAYSQYNWELFFHVPLLLAQRLSANQRFAEAQRWFHRIFDPTDSSGLPAPQRFWRTKPFYETTDPKYQAERIEDILDRLGSGDATVNTAVSLWLDNPFQPDVVARLRTTAYQKAVVMKYLDNLIAWGDQLFRQDTAESVNEATQLYILAAELLGRRPDEVNRDDQPPQSYKELTAQQGALAAALTGAENLIPATSGSLAPAIAPGMGNRLLTYFRIPRNEKLMGYWDTVADRLGKIRQGQNIDGVRRQLALFGAEIDPGLLVRATSAGVDVSGAIDEMSAPLPHYRFTPMVAKAKEFVAEVRAFGSALISALEKRDAEALSRLRAGHEVAVLDAARAVREQQVAEATDTVAALQKSQEAAKQKQDYYTDPERRKLNDNEKAHTLRMADSHRQQETAADVSRTASTISYLPDLKIGFPTTIGATWGSSNIIAGLNGRAGANSTDANRSSSEASLSATLGGYERRDEDWAFQGALAATEFEQIGKQIAAAEKRKGTAERELANHDRQRANAREADRFLRDKYTGQELYDWMAGQLSTAYFQAYQLAFDVAKRSERAYRYELGLDDSAFIRFGYWDTLHKGLLAGEKLAADLNRLDASYVELNARELELTKRVSLAQLDPNALLRLKETGRCFVSLPEAAFDLDCPGHYMRRLKSVAITVPCVAGPYTSVNLTATLVRSSVRVDPRLNGGKHARQPGDTRFRDRIGAVETVVTSSGQDDSGLFETNLRDERYLPFEGDGAISEWQLSLPAAFRQFDYETISDVVLHLRYTARDGGSALATPAVQELDDALNDWVHGGGGKALYRTFSARRESSGEWHRFLAPAPGAESKLTFALSKDRLPFLFRGLDVTVAKPELVLVLSRDLVPGGSTRYVDVYAVGAQLKPVLTTPKGSTSGVALTADPSLGGLPRCGYQTVTAQIGLTDQNWTVTIPREQIEALDPLLRTEDGGLDPTAVVDLLLVCPYTLIAKNLEVVQ